jgi:hypothetical protein
MERCQKENKMSLICSNCDKIIIVSNNPDHLARCAACGVSDMTKEERNRIQRSSEEFRKASYNKQNNLK